jgi:hypothetical protein
MSRPFACAVAASLATLAIVPGEVMAEDRLAKAGENISGGGDTVLEAVPGLFDSPAVSESTLQTIAGREDVTQVSQADLAAGVSRNSVGDNSTTGTAQIDGNAFQNMSGLSILNVNTGNNVAINAAMNVNVSISHAP